MSAANLSVLHVCTDFWPSTGGIERFVLDLARHSAAAGVQASVLCFDRSASSQARMPAHDIVAGIPVHRIGFVDLKFYKPALLPLAMLRRHDIVHVHGVGAQLDYAVATKWLHGRPIVLSTHGGLFHTPALLPLKRLYFFGLQRVVAKFVDAIVACSGTDQTLFSRISRRVGLIENGVDVASYLAMSRDAQERGRCLHVGRLSDNKGVAELLRAFAVASEKGVSFQLRLVGRDVDGNQARYERLARDLGIGARVVFCGEIGQDALLDEYRRAQVFVSASRYEGFGLSALEAKAAGLTLVLNRNAAFDSLFSRDSDAVLVDFSQARIAGQVLVATLAGEPVVPSTRHRADVYSWRHKVVEWDSLYRSCVARH